MSVIARGKLGDHEIEADVVNPGDWWGRLWLIEVGCGYGSVYYGVEADTASDALDEFADSKHVHHIQIDVELEGGDYGMSSESGKGWVNLKGEVITDPEKFKYLSEPSYLGNAGTPCNTEHILIHGPAKVKGFTYFDADDVDCQDIPPELYGEREKRWIVVEDETGDTIMEDFRTEKAARDWMVDNKLDYQAYTVEEI